MESLGDWEGLWSRVRTDVVSQHLAVAEALGALATQPKQAREADPSKRRRSAWKIAPDTMSHGRTTYVVPYNVLLLLLLLLSPSLLLAPVE